MYATGKNKTIDNRWNLFAAAAATTEKWYLFSAFIVVDTIEISRKQRYTRFLISKPLRLKAVLVLTADRYSGVFELGKELFNDSRIERITLQEV